MNVLDIKSEYKEQLDSLWDKTRLHGAFSKIVENGYAMSTDIATDSVLFVGLNPSYRKNDTSPSHFFALHEYEQRERKGKKDSYFTHFFEINKDTGLNCSYLDMLFVRTTDSKIVKALLHDKEAEPFIQAQLAIFKKILKAARPRVISVNNAVARDFLLKESDAKNFLLEEPDAFTLEEHSDYQQDKNIKAYVIQGHPTLAGVTVFFTGMLVNMASRYMPNDSRKNFTSYIRDAAKQRR